MIVLLDPSHEILTDISEGGVDELRRIERAGRIAYQSNHKIDPDNFDSCKRFIKMLIKRGHESVLEHSSLSVHFVTDRGVTHELVRHRLCAFTQESTRYCNYANDKFGDCIRVIVPEWADVLNVTDRRYPEYYWYHSCLTAEADYMKLISMGLQPQDARGVLPTCLKADIVITTNYREWRHIFKLRCAPDAHPEIRRVMNGLLTELKQRIPVIFDDLP